MTHTSIWQHPKRPEGQFPPAYLVVNHQQQKMALMDAGRVLHTYLISSALRGLGELQGSLQTPRGWHKISAKIGNGCPLNSVFVGRRATGECYTPELGAQFPERDWILTRILWLCGLEPGVNRFGTVDSQRRYIYIHGTADEIHLGQPRSHGCVRMANADIIELFTQVPVGTLLYSQRF